MIESVLIVSQTIIILSLLVYHLFKERIGSKEMDRFKGFFNEQTVKNNDFTLKSLSAYLKHIQQLEKIVLDNKKPRPIDEDHIKEVLMRGPEPAENEISRIEDDGSIELNETNFKNIPFGVNTSVLFEGDMPTTVEE